MVKKGVTEEELAGYEPGQAWLLFRVDIMIGEEHADVGFLVDIGSSFLFGVFTTSEVIPDPGEVKNLMREGFDTTGRWPRFLYCYSNDPALKLFERIAREKKIQLCSGPASAFFDITDPIIDVFNKGSSAFRDTPGEDFENISAVEVREARLMIPDAYDPCSCASGKKFKFCCKPAYKEITEAMYLAEAGRVNEAVKQMDKAKERIGLTPEILCRYAIVYSFSDREKCCKYRDRCLEMNPRHPRANYIMGIDLKEKGDYEGALEAYLRAAGNYPPGDKFHLNEVWNNIGTVYYETGDFHNAREAWEKALEYMPHDRMAGENLQMLTDYEEKAGRSSFSKEIEELMKDKDFDSIEEMNQFLGEYTMRKNNTPREEFGGLSPVDMAALLGETVYSEKSQVILSGDIKEKLLESSLFYRDGKKFLKLFNERDPVKMTTAKNLNRKFVSKAIEICDYKKERETWFYKKTINEQDFWWLHIIRVVFEVGGLIKKRKGFFRITVKGRELLNKPPGEFYRVLFKTFFYKFNLDYLIHYGPELPDIQNTVNFSLFMARDHCRKWTVVKDFTETVIFNGLRLDEKLDTGTEIFSNRENLMRGYHERFIMPAVNFGLFDVKKGSGRIDFFGMNFLIKTSPLLKKFINFKF